MEAQRILVHSDDPTDGRNLALELFRAGYLALSAGAGDLSDLIMPKPDLLIVSLSPRLEHPLDLAQVSREMQCVPLVVVSALGLSQLEGPLQLLPIVSAVLFRPYSQARLLEAVEGALAAPAAGLSDFP